MEPVVSIDLSKIPKDWSVEKWLKYYKNTGLIFMSSEIPTNKILRVIDGIQKYSPEYGVGNCYGFFKLLKAIFPRAEAYYNSNHIITKIDDVFYDRKGVADSRKVESKEYLSVKEHFGYELLDEQYKDVL